MNLNKSKIRTTVETEQRMDELFGTQPQYLLTALIILKLTGHISISWWWVSSPFWLGFFFITLFGVLGTKKRTKKVTTTTTEEL